MGKIIISLVFAILFISFVSAEIIINQQPDNLYNLGDSIITPVIVKSANEVSGILEMNLVCDNQEINFYKNGVKLSAGEEKNFESILVLTKTLIGETVGNCKIKAILGVSYALTNEFKISNQININSEFSELELIPGETLSIGGNAIKENGENADGFVEIIIFSGNESNSISYLNTINNGLFSVDIALAKNMKAGAHTIRLNIFEKDMNGQTTNKGTIDYEIRIKQIPTNIEIVFENPEVEPGTNLQVKAILRDQTGEKISTNSFITIKDNKDHILNQVEHSTDKFLEFPIAYNSPPVEWTVVAVSNQISAEATLKIKEKREIKVNIINKTVTITNIGNIPYKEILSVKIGSDSVDLDVDLDVDQSQKYILTAPDGEYKVEILSGEESKASQNVILSGRAIDVKKASSGVIKIVRHPFVWFFIIGILGFIAFMIMKKGYKRSFIGYIHSRKKKDKEEGSIGEILIPLRKKSKITSKNKAELSLSIKGEKQNASLICLKIKNLKEIESTKNNAEETLQKIVDFADENKAATYENQENLFFILAPIKTKTFKNEKTAINIAQKIKQILKDHNKMFKQKIHAGISLNYGTIVAKQEKDSMKFMSMGTLITTAKKIASISEGEIYLGEKIKSRLGSEVRGEKIKKNDAEFYTIKQINDSEENKKFVRSFLNRIEGKK